MRTVGVQTWGIALPRLREYWVRAEGLGLAEGIEVIKALWAGSPVDFTGEFLWD